MWLARSRGSQRNGLRQRHHRGGLASCVIVNPVRGMGLLLLPLLAHRY
jgi:hypothetical protein